jgi:predicted enzyme related to lactoylglutathione lyase
MAEQPQMKPGTFCWMELLTRDAAKAKAFYTELLGWNTSEMPMPGEDCEGVYTMFSPGGPDESVGGMFEMAGPEFEGVPPHWMAYIAVESVDDSTAKAQQLGAEVKCPPMDIPGIGRFSIIADPTGAVVSLFQGL